MLSTVGLTIKFSKACVFFKAGKNRDGYFDGEDLLQQVENVINIFKAKSNGFATGLFCLTMLPATKNEPQMLSQQVRC